METFTPPCPRSTSGFFGKNKTWNANQIEEKLPNHISIGTIHHVETGSKSGRKKNYNNNIFKNYSLANISLLGNKWFMLDEMT